MATAMSFGVPNYSGMLFRYGNDATPFSTMLGAPLQTNHVEFTCGQYYAVETGEQPSISENASLTAPTATVVTRNQLTNVTQIFQSSVSVSYAKMSNMGTLSGINVENQVANPQDELDFQVQRKMAKIAQDIEYTFLNGVYVKSTSDSVANQSRGLITAISSNVIDCNDEVLTYQIVAEGIKALYDMGADTSNLILGVDATTALQLNYDAQSNNMTIVPRERNINGIAIDTVVTPLGTIGVKILPTLPAGTAILYNPMIMHPVFQPVPGKGNFFLEELSRTGAGANYMIFGQAGLDHGPEWFSAKFTNISTALPGHSEITISGDSTVAVGGTITLTASGADSITWTSSDESVATVSSGVVTGVAAGNATITAASGRDYARLIITVTE